MGNSSWWSVLLMGALGLLAVGLAWRLFTRRRVSASATVLADQGVSGAQLHAPVSPRAYSPGNVGNDASARPWETQLGEAAPGGGMPEGFLASRLPGGMPAGFDAEAFLQASKTNFIHLQAAWDRSDVASLRAMMTDGMLEQIQAQLAERERSGASGSQTEVVMLDARLLGMEELESAHMASVEFSGLVREEASAGPNPFREVWNITRPRSGQGGWLVSGVQAMD